MSERRGSGVRCMPMPGEGAGSHPCRAAQKDVIFNPVVLIDLMLLHGRAKLHIVNKYTLFSAATFLRDGKSTAGAWDAFMSV